MLRDECSQWAKSALDPPDGRRIVRMSDRQGLSFYDPVAKESVGYLAPASIEPLGPRSVAAPKRALLEQRILAAVGLSLAPERDDGCELVRKQSGADLATIACDEANGRAFGGDYRGSVNVYDTRTGGTLATLPYAPYAAYGRRATTHIAIAPNGKLVASWNEDGTLLVRDASSRYETRLERHGMGVVTCLSWSKDGRHVALFSGAVLRVVRLGDGAMLRVEEGIASDDAGAFEDLGVAATGFDLVGRNRSSVERGRAAMRVRVGDIATGDLLPLSRAAELARPDLSRAFLAPPP